MILESGMNFFDDFYYPLAGLSATDSKISKEINLGSPNPFKKGGSQANLLAYCMEGGLTSTGTNVSIVISLQSKDVGGEYGTPIIVTTVKVADIVPGEPIIDMVLPKNTKQIVSLKAKLTGTDPAITAGKLFANIKPHVG